MAVHIDQLDFKTALTFARQVIDVNQLELDPEALYYSAYLCGTMNERLSSIKFLETLIMLTPYSVPAYLLKARLHTQLQEYQEAAKLLNKAEELNPNSAPCKAFQAFHCLLTDKSIEALQFIDKAIELDPKTVRYQFIKLFILLNWNDVNPILAQLQLSKMAVD